MGTQIYLSDEVKAEIKQSAEELGYSVSSYLVLCHKKYQEIKDNAGTFKGLFTRR